MKKYKGYYPMANISVQNNDAYYPYNSNSMPNNQRPIYLPSGIQTPYDDDEANYEEADIEYMKSMYPDFCKKVQVYVDEECDRLEYDGSYMYDEYPDRETIEKITDRILDSVKTDDRFNNNKDEHNHHNNHDMHGNKDLKEMQFYDYDYDYQRDLIKLLLLNEIFNRRRSRFYGGRRRRIQPYYPQYYNNYRQYFD